MALLVTLIVLLILAGISLSGLFSGKGLFKRTEDASSRYNEAKAREVLETMLLTDGQFEKNTNPKYNQDKFLDELIKKEIPGSNVIEDVAIIGGEYAYELDRSVPKIGHYLGNPKDLIWPKVTTTEPVLADDYRSASFTITATIDEKATKGITRIEVWLLGEIIKEYKYTDNTKDTRTETFETKRNGEYTIKAYAELMGSNKTTVEGIVPAVEFMPNGRTEWKKQHSTKIIVKETAEKVKSLKYKWTNSVKAPEVGDFLDAGSCNNNDTITGKDFTGIYYLWVLLEMDTTPIKTNICGSEGFYFDNEDPTGTLTPTPNSETSFKLTATASDNHSGIEKYEFFIDGKLVDTQNVSEETATYTWNGTEMTENKECYVIVTDRANNTAKYNTNARTKLYTWKRFSINRVMRYSFTSWVYTGTGNYSYLSGYTGEPTISDPYSSSVTHHGTFVNGTSDNLKGYGTIYSTYGTDKYVSSGSQWAHYERKKNSDLVREEAGTYLGNEASKNKDTYPEDGKQDGSWYKYLEIQ